MAKHRRKHRKSRRRSYRRSRALAGVASLGFPVRPVISIGVIAAVAAAGYFAFKKFLKKKPAGVAGLFGLNATAIEEVSGLGRWSFGGKSAADAMKRAVMTTKPAWGQPKPGTVTVGLPITAGKPLVGKLVGSIPKTAVTPTAKPAQLSRGGGFAFGRPAFNRKAQGNRYFASGR